MAESTLAVLLRINLVASVAVVGVLALRPFVLARFGARINYCLWLIVPIAVLMSILPAREIVVSMSPEKYAATVAELPFVTSSNAQSREGTIAALREGPVPALPSATDLLAALWLSVAGALLLRSILNTRRLAADPLLGPALVGVLRPRLVLPADFESRFEPAERALILAHEEFHRVSRHTVVNAIVEVVRCANWFNPLIHLAAGRMRADQELSCDAAVIAKHPHARRTYGQALLKTQIAPSFLPLGCTWTSPSAQRLGERIALLGRPSVGQRARRGGACVVTILGLAIGVAAWAQQTGPVVLDLQRPDPAWTVSADAPDGSLSHELEARRHDSFIERARQGSIDVVFFGTTDTEMWSWEERGRSVWDREFGSLQAANFGSQGTSPRSLLWRFRNGELDGYEAKLIVWQTWGPAIFDDAESDSLTTAQILAAFIAEMRARQPQAKILLMPPLPRGQTNLAGYEEVAAQNESLLADVVDHETVFYVDFGGRFFLPDGHHNQQLWHFPPLSGLVDVGIQTPAFEIWADELQPWLDRFVR